MSRIYLADKQTLDTVNTKVGVSSDTESATPTTLFAGVKNIIKGITELKKSVSDGKTKVANAITGKGITTATNAAFATMANNINAITTLAQGTNDANATTAQILSGRTAYVKGSKITGTIPSKGAATITPGTSNQTIGAGQYLSGVQTIAGSANLVPGNIKQGVNLFGVVGNVREEVALSQRQRFFSALENLNGISKKRNDQGYSGYDYKGTATLTFSRPVILVNKDDGYQDSSTGEKSWIPGVGIAIRWGSPRDMFTPATSLTVILNETCGYMRYIISSDGRTLTITANLESTSTDLYIAVIY